MTARHITSNLRQSLRATARRSRWPLFGACAAALVLAGTGGASHFGPLYLGHANTSDAQTTLTANLANPVLKAVNQGTASALRGDAQNGIGVNGVSVTGTGQQGQSQSGIGLLGIHSNSTGVNPGVQGTTNSTDPNGAGVLGRNNGGGPGLRAFVNAGAPPLAVNSDVKVANLNADLLDGMDASAFQNRVTGTCATGSAINAVNANGTVSCETVGGAGTAWSLTGNAGTTPGTDFLGTTDDKALELKVNGERALRLEPDPTDGFGPNVIGGSSANSVSAGIAAATIGGGGDPFSPNVVSAIRGTVSGGANNKAASLAATVGGGDSNDAFGAYSVIPGGTGNDAAGTASFAAGQRAQAVHNGTFVWSDSSATSFPSTAERQFLIRAANGVGIGTNAPARQLDVNGVVGVFDDARNRNGGMATEADSTLIDFGMNDGPLNRFGGIYTQADQGGFVRVDTRPGQPVISFEGRPAGGSSDTTRLGSISAGGTVRFEIGTAQKFSLGGNGSFEIDAFGIPAGRFVVTQSGNVGIGTPSPTFQLQLSQDSAAKPGSNTWTVPSDRRLKKDVRPFSDGLATLERIDPVRYVLNGRAGTPAGEAGIGVIAQEVKDVIPYTISTSRAKLDPDDAKPSRVYGFDSSALTFVTINAVKELARENRALRRELAAVKQRERRLEARVAAIERSIRK